MRSVGGSTTRATAGALRVGMRLGPGAARARRAGEVRPDKIVASSEDAVLMVVVPEKPGAKPKQIAVKAA